MAGPKEILAGSWEIIEETLKAALGEYGPGHLLAILFFIGIMWRHEKLWMARLKDKDNEIHRIAKERDKYQDYFLQIPRKSAELNEQGEPKL